MGERIKLAVICLPLVLFLFGCGSKKVDYPAPSAKAEGGSFVSKPGTFKFGNKNYIADYGTITVKENRSNPSSRLIHLPVIRIHARTKNTNEPIFGLAGGPGQSNMNWSPVDSLLYDHDFVMVGYRGVEGSVVLDCPEVADAIKDGGDDLLGEQSLKQIAKAWQAGIKRFRANGVDLDGYNIQETVDDMEAVRKAFNYIKINLISESYGTRVAYIYGLMHPERIARTVMVGANPPGKFFWDPQVVNKQLNYYSGLWSSDSSKLNESRDLAATMENVLSNMPRKWLFFTINPGKLKVVAFSLLFQRKTAAMVFDSFIAAEKGDYSGLALMSIACDYTFPNMFVFGDLFLKAASADLEYLPAVMNGKKNQNTVLGSSLNDLLWKQVKYEKLPVKLIPGDLRSLKKSDVETLILSGSVDFSCPAENGKELLSYLKNSRQIILSEYGHVGDLRYYNRQKSDRIITSFFNKGIADTAAVQYASMDFNVPLGFPLIMKIGISVIVIILMLIIIAIYNIIKKVQRKKMKNIISGNDIISD
jgi:pimeloyl-ACP methyl ester carboxylesterase